MYICIAVGDLIIKRSIDEIPFTGLIPPHICVCSMPGSGFPRSYVVVFLGWEVIVR